MVRRILPPTRSYMAAIGAVMAALGVAVLTFGVTWDAALAPGWKVVALAVGLTFSMSLFLIARKLLSGRGGILVSDGRLGLGLTCPQDTWWLDVASLSGVRVVPAERKLPDAWLVVIERTDGVAVVVARSADRAKLDAVAADLAEAIGVDHLDGHAAEVIGEPPEAAGRAAFGVRRGAALQWVLFFFGISLFAVGLVMFANVEDRPIFGFVFGPLLGFLGLALLAVTVVKRFAAEELSFDGVSWTHTFGIGRYRWGTRTVRATRPGWRIVLHAMRGAHLELVGDNGILVMASGATTLSRIGLERIAALPGHFSAHTHSPQGAPDGTHSLDDGGAG